MEITKEEAIHLYNYLSHEYIPYEDTLLIEFVRKLYAYVKEEIESE